MFIQRSSYSLLELFLKNESHGCRKVIHLKGSVEAQLLSKCTGTSHSKQLKKKTIQKMKSLSRGKKHPHIRNEVTAVRWLLLPYLAKETPKPQCCVNDELQIFVMCSDFPSTLDLSTFQNLFQSWKIPGLQQQPFSRHRIMSWHFETNHTKPTALFFLCILKGCMSVKRPEGLHFFEIGHAIFESFGVITWNFDIMLRSVWTHIANPLSAIYFIFFLITISAPGLWMVLSPEHQKSWIHSLDNSAASFPTIACFNIIIVPTDSSHFPANFPTFFLSLTGAQMA